MPDAAPPADLPDLPKTKQPHGRAAALAVATGILLSKIIGLIRERVFAYYFGNSMAADAFKAAFISVDQLNVTGTAARTATALGFDRDGIVATIQTMQRSQFYKSMTAYDDHRM